jgi:hypothetical protein
MANLNFKKKDVVIIVLFFVLYGTGYAWLIEPKDKSRKKIEKESIIPKSENQQTEIRQPKSLSIIWPDTCEQYEREFDEASYYQDHYDEYQDDPEDEIRFPPEIFDANDD